MKVENEFNELLKSITNDEILTIFIDPLQATVIALYDGKVDIRIPDELQQKSIKIGFLVD